ncbi:hypothetical protein RMCBS344292_19509 [Rhizopus microsporus]|nr:hypothetical protein RMCBS344292_19509 [Rhizopus microsporus]
MVDLTLRKTKAAQKKVAPIKKRKRDNDEAIDLVEWCDGNHGYDVHVDTLQVTINKKTTIVKRINSKFSCPDCPSRLSTSRSFNDHLKKKHKGTCSALSKAERRRDMETDDDDNGSSVLMKHYKPSIRENNFSTDRLVI